MAAFVVRLMGKESEALKKTASTGFLDDASIPLPQSLMCYTKRCWSNPGGANVNFNPKDKVTKECWESSADALKPAGNSVQPINWAANPQPRKEVYLQGTVGKVSHQFTTYSFNMCENKQSYYYIKKDAPI